MGRVRYLLFAAAVLTVGLWLAPGLSGRAAAADPAGQWSAHGPSGGNVSEVEVGPDGTVYAGTGAAGVFTSRERHRGAPD
jgi:hypothetical protein